MAKEEDKMLWRERIELLRKEFIGRKVKYEGETYTIVAVDYNGIIHIDKPTKYNETTAVYTTAEARRNFV